jgi:hypothetical protein
MTSPPDLSVVVVNWNTRDLLKQCLHSVRETVGELNVESIVVDNASTDGSSAMVRREFPEVRLIENVENVGFARANNQALQISQGRLVLLLNSDTVVRAGALQAMCHFMDQHPEAGIVGAKLLNPDGSFQASYMDFPTILSEVLLLTKLYRLFYPSCFPSHSLAESLEVCEADWVSGACLAIRRETIEQVGGLDEGYFMYSEEVDWCWRVKQAGWKIFYLPQAEVMHWGGQSIKRISVHKRARVYRGKVLFFRKHRGRGYAAVFRLILLLSTVLKMGMWSLALLAPNKCIRSQAQSNLRSYRFLIEEV